MPKLPISINGISSLKDGINLTNEAYNLNTIPAGYTEFHAPIDDSGTGLQAKFMQKDNTVYVLVAGTNYDTKTDIAYNWTTKGAAQFHALDPALREVIILANNNEKNIVVVGDSGGGFVAQHAYLKYGVDAFCTNTTGIWQSDVRIDIQFQDHILYNPNGKMVTVVNDGEPLSTDIGAPSYGEVYVIPSKEGALKRYSKEILGEPSMVVAVGKYKDGIAAHVDRQYMMNYLDSGGKLYSPDAINYGTYIDKYPDLMPVKSYSSQAVIADNSRKNPCDNYGMSNFQVINVDCILAATISESDQVANWKAKYDNMIKDISNSCGDAKEMARRINYYNETGQLEAFRVSGVDVNGKLQELLHDRYLNVKQDIRNGIDVGGKEEVEHRINSYKNNGELSAFKVVGFYVDNDLSVVRNDVHIANQYKGNNYEMPRSSSTSQDINEKNIKKDSADPYNMVHANAQGSREQNVTPGLSAQTGTPPEFQSAQIDNTAIRVAEMMRKINGAIRPKDLDSAYDISDLGRGGMALIDITQNLDKQIEQNQNNERTQGRGQRIGRA